MVAIEVLFCFFLIFLHFFFFCLFVSYGHHWDIFFFFFFGCAPWVVVVVFFLHLDTLTSPSPTYLTSVLVAWCGGGIDGVGDGR